MLTKYISVLDIVPKTKKIYNEYGLSNIAKTNEPLNKPGEIHTGKYFLFQQKLADKPFFW